MKKRPRSLVGLLRAAAAVNNLSQLTFHACEKNVSQSLTYSDLLDQSQAKAELLRRLIPGIDTSKVVLLHFDKLQQSIEWFWAVLVAGCIPALSPPFTNNAAQHTKHLSHLCILLDNPVVLTSERLSSAFEGQSGLSVHTVESLLSSSSGSPSSERKGTNQVSSSAYNGPNRDTAVIMLTSGSTGSAKAVPLSTQQILSAVAGKSQALATSTDDIFLNWIGLDHVAALTEVHLHAMSLAASQVHVDAAELMAEPLRFLRALHKFRVSFSFAPNFFLAKLEQDLAGALEDRHELDLSRLRVITSGGEANSVGTAVKLLARLEKHGAPCPLIHPGFGMTETCAGSIYNTRFPDYEIARNLSFASLGQCVPGIQMRVRLSDGTYADRAASGMLQVAGPVVFDGYLRNSTATAAAFSEDDGWFTTGDVAYIDAEGMLHLTGREKETLNINGVKYNLEDIENAIEDAQIGGVAPSFTKAFAVREANAETESLVITYQAAFPSSTNANDDNEARTRVHLAVTRACQLQCGANPLEVLPLPSSAMPKSSLGKISRAKLCASYLAGEYAPIQAEHAAALRRHAEATFQSPSNEVERRIQAITASIMGLDDAAGEISVSTGLMHMGVSSLEVIKFKQQLQDAFSIEDVPMITILTNPTIASLAVAISDLSSKPKGYDPVVVLGTEGTKLPLWLVHPGAGEILVYLNLAKQINDRPLYALRARGFEDGETFFENIPELVNTYHAHIKRVQPRGPYAILGYSFGSMFAAEISKKLLAEGEQVKFTGVLNLPPHVQYRIRQLNMVTAILTLALFLDLIQDDDPDAFHPDIDSMTHDQLLDEVLRRSGLEKLHAVGLDRDKFMRWATVSNALHMIAWDYVPEGKLPCVDVWVAHPLKAVARNKEEWFEKQMLKWHDFADTTPRFYDAEGEHFTMINADNTPRFARQLKAALHARGV